MKIKVVAGTPLHCHREDNTTKTQSEDVLGTVLALAFSPNGDFYIAEADTRKVNYVRLIDSSGKITHFAGKIQDRTRSNCDCSNNATTASPRTGDPPPACICGNTDETTSNAETLLSSNARFQAISALTVSPGGVLHVADQGSLHILALQHYLPTHDENGEFRIPYPAAGEIYVFNRYGQHVATKDLASDKTRYSFLYSKNTSFGKLSTVTDSSGNKIQFLRDYSNAVSSIENTQDHKSELKISGVGYLVKLSEKGRSEIELDYDMNSGLLTSRSGVSCKGVVKKVVKRAIAGRGDVHLSVRLDRQGHRGDPLERGDPRTDFQDRLRRGFGDHRQQTTHAAHRHRQSQQESDHDRR
jgi:hypothetical protein